MKNEKLYFENNDSETCHELSDHITNAKIEGLSEIELIEAIPAKEIKNEIWCTEIGMVVHRSECRKHQCGYFHSTKGRICDFRGKLYNKGKKVKIAIN